MTFEFRTHENGNVCCSNPDPALRCAKCQEHAAQQSAAYPPPDPYAAGLKALRAASAPTTTEARFAEQWKSERRRAMAATRAALDAEFQS